MFGPNRVEPKLPAEAMKTYSVIAPQSTHFRRATCEEVDCPNLRFGWQTVIDESTELGKQQAYYIRNQSGRKFSEDRNSAPGITAFVFESGQKCFSPHQIRLDKPDIYLVRDGDFRGNPRGTAPRRHVNGDDWVEDFSEHQDKLSDAIEKG